jgi:ribonuclease E
MLINAQRPEELRIAIVRDRTLENFQVDVAESGLTRGNIYRGTIANIQPSLNAAFIDYGIERHGFLAIQDVVGEAYYHPPRGGQPRIEEVLERGKPIIVQVARDAIGQKGASLTTSLSLAGRYLVLTPFDDTRGVSRKVEDEETRRKLKALVSNLDLPPGCGVIVRTNALDQNKTAIGRDLAALLRLWKRVQAAATNGKGSRLLYSDQDLIVQALRDHLDSTIEEVLVDDDAAFQKAEAYVEAFMPRAKIRLERYEERLPLFSRFDLEPQIDSIYDRRVELPSGGSIVIDATEALTAIDVNSGRSTRAATQEETAVHTNLEAAAEVARQLRLRDIGGLVVVDFIDMRAGKNQRRVEKAMRDAMKADKARSSVGRISPNGLLEINRQRIQQALQMRTHRPCPTCAGTGRLASPEMVTLGLLRRIEARAASGLVQEVRIKLHPELADAMQNSRRQELAALEREFDLRIEVIAAAGLHRPDEQIEWLKRERPAAPPARPKPAVVALQPWDLALAAGAEPEPPAELEQPAEARQAGRDRPAGGAGQAPGGRRRGGGPARLDRPERAPRRQAGSARAPSAPTAPSVPSASVAPSGQSAASGLSGPNGDEQEARRGRKRRRGGRKRKRGAAPGDEGEEAREATTQELPPIPDSSASSGAPAPVPAASAAASTGAPPAAAKRSRRRRRRGHSQASLTSPAATSEGSPTGPAATSQASLTSPAATSEGSPTGPAATSGEGSPGGGALPSHGMDGGRHGSPSREAQVQPAAETAPPVPAATREPDAE